MSIHPLGSRDLSRATRRGALWLAAGLMLSSGLLLFGCPSEPLESPGLTTLGGEGGAVGGTAATGKAGGRTMGGMPSTGTSGSPGKSGGGGCEALDIPAEVPAGWVPQPLFDCRFRIYVPPSRELLPPPLAWEPCAVPGPDIPKDACRQLAINWKTDGKNATGGTAQAYVEADGTVVLQLRHIYDQASTGKYAAMGLVAPADGDVRQALFTSFASPVRPAIGVGQSGVAAGRASWFVMDLGTDSLGALVGQDDELAPRALFAPDGIRGGVRAGPRWLIETTPQGTFHIVDWETGDSIATAFEDGAAANIPRFAGETLYFSYAHVALVIWTKEAGAVALRTFQEPESAGASFGTDGKDMVWIEGANRIIPAEPMFNPEYETRTIYTAPFTTEPQAVKPRRLRSWPGTLIGSVEPPVVSCGYAAFIDNSPIDDHPMMIVRLKDGVSWQIRSGDVKLYEKWGGPVALNCTELFASFGGNLARIELSRLGPGEQPD